MVGGARVQFTVAQKEEGRRVSAPPFKYSCAYRERYQLPVAVVVVVVPTGTAAPVGVVAVTVPFGATVTTTVTGLLEVVLPSVMVVDTPVVVPVGVPAVLSVMLQLGTVIV